MAPAKIRRIRVYQRAIAALNSPTMDADPADLRGSRREEREEIREEESFPAGEGFSG